MTVATLADMVLSEMYDAVMVHMKRKDRKYNGDGEISQLFTVMDLSLCNFAWRLHFSSCQGSS